MVCPSRKKFFVIHSSWSWSRFECKFEGPIAETVLKEDDNNIMDVATQGKLGEQTQWLHCSNTCHKGSSNRLSFSRCLISA